MYQKDAIASLRGLRKSLRPGALVVFQEQDATLTPASLTRLPLHETAYGWVRKCVDREGADMSIGFKLHAHFSAAGLRVANVRAECVLQTVDSGYLIVDILRVMTPRIVAQGVATPEEMDLPTLERRLADERRAANATLLSDMVFGIAARVPGTPITGKVRAN